MVLKLANIFEIFCKLQLIGEDADADVLEVTKRNIFKSGKSRISCIKADCIFFQVLIACSSPEVHMLAHDEKAYTTSATKK
jgi:hypothetical protein